MNEAENTAIQKFAQDSTPAPTLEVLTLEVKFYLNQTAQNIIEVGKRLNQAKELVPHGEWGKWLESNFKLSKMSASRFMRVADRFGKSNDVVTFQASQMVELLALPAEETEQFIEAKAAKGKLVLLAEARLGELFSQLPKAGHNQYTKNGNACSTCNEKAPATETEVETPKPKLETARDMGFSKDQVSQFQRLAENPDAVQKAIVTAEERASTALAGRNCTSSYRVRGKIRR